MTDWTAFDRPEVRAGFAATAGESCQVLIALDGIHCSACAARAERLLAGQAESVSVNLAARTLSFRFKPQQKPLSVLLRALDEAGLQPRVLAREDAGAREVRERRRAFARIGVATICAMQVMMLAWPSYFGVQPEPAIAQLLRWAQLVVAAPGVLWAGWPFFEGAWRAARGRALDMNGPVALALAIAFGASAWRTVAGSGDLYFDSATMFVWFLAVGRYLESRTRARAGEHLRLLAGRRALTAQRRVATGLETVAIGQLRPGDVAVVAPGDAVPADGVLLEQPLELDESLLTGESQAVLRHPGEPVLAGAINVGAAPLALQVGRCGADTVLAQITQLMNRAHICKPRLQQIADRIAGHFVAAVLLLAGLGYALALHRGASQDAALGIVLAVLVASCPCALSLAVPAALAAATSRLARSGVLVANAGALQALAAIDTVLFDKTGTLTRTEMKLQRVIPLAGLDEQSCTAIAAALEHGSRHPIATAFAGIAAAAADELRQAAGAGVSGRVDGQHYWLGAAEHAPCPVRLPETQPGETLVVLCGAERALACFVLSANLRPEVPALVEELERRRLSLELQSGDAPATVQALAQRLGIERYAARQTPQAKLQRLQQLQAGGARVLAIGDGVNDAPLLAAADVSAAMPHGAALAQSRADLLLLGDSLAPVTLALDVSHAVQRRIRENLLWALGYNLLVLPLAMSGHLPPWLAAAGMSLSSVVVVANALRLDAVVPRRAPTPALAVVEQR